MITYESALELITHAAIIIIIKPVINSSQFTVIVISIIIEIDFKLNLLLLDRLDPT